MPTLATETTWGIWGEPLPLKPWQNEPKLSHTDGGGEVKEGFADTLKWYYKKTRNPNDKEQCLRLLAQIETQKEEKTKKKKRPQTASLAVQATSKQIHARPRTASYRQADRKKKSYKEQLESTQRLSRPRTAKPQVNTHLHKQRYRFVERPKSAMATVGHKRCDDPYRTTHERDFQGYPSGLYTEAFRPMSSKGFTAPYKLGDPLGKTTCQQEFPWKKAEKVEPIIAGSSSGNRKNNPHPHEAFMVWKFPRNKTEGMSCAPAEYLGYRELTNNVLDQIVQDKFKSTYQSDYLGIPQGYQVKDAIDAPVDWRKNIDRPLHTTTRRTYKPVKREKELVGNFTRYGCNQKKPYPAVGVVPTVTSEHLRNQEQVKRQTTYDSQFTNGYNKPDLMKLLNAQTNSKVIDRFLRYSKADIDTKTQIQKNWNGPNGRKIHRGPQRTSGWAGPHHHYVQ